MTQPQYRPWCEKTGLVFGVPEPCNTQTSLLSYRDYLKYWTLCKISWGVIQRANKKRHRSDCADAQAGLCLCCSHANQVFLRLCPYYATPNSASRTTCDDLSGACEQSDLYRNGLCTTWDEKLNVRLWWPLSKYQYHVSTVFESALID